MLFLEVAEFEVSGAEVFVEGIFRLVSGEVVGSGIITREATEGFFEGGEAGPGVVFRGVFGGDSPEVEVF